MRVVGERDAIEVHPPDAGQQRQRREDRGDHGEQAHHLVGAVRGEASVKSPIDSKLFAPLDLIASTISLKVVWLQLQTS